MPTTNAPPDPIETMRQAFAAILANPPPIPDVPTTRTDGRRAVGDVRKAMVDDALEEARNRPGNLRADFDVEAFGAEAAEFETWETLDETHKRIGSLIAARKKASGSKVYRKSLEVYEANKTAAKSDPSAKPTVERLAKHFANIGAGRKKTVPNPLGTNPA